MDPSGEAAGRDRAEVGPPPGGRRRPAAGHYSRRPATQAATTDQEGTAPEAAPTPLTPESQLVGSGLVAPTTARRLERAGIVSIEDLLFHLPRRYDDLTRPRSLRSLREEPPQEPVSSIVEILDLQVEQTFRRRVQRTTARLRDASGEGEAIWFGRRFVERRLRAGQTALLSGRVTVRGWLPRYENPEFGPVDDHALHAGRIVPVYRLAGGVSLPALRAAIRAALDAVGTAYPEYLPDEVREAAPGPLEPIGAALEAAHYPDDFAARDAALRRLAFDELLALQVGMVARDRRRRQATAHPIAVDESRFSGALVSVEATIGQAVRRRLAAAPDPERQAAAETFVAHLTADQRAAIGAIREDLTDRRPMLRLLQGDVGSGKTAVAALALAFVADAGAQGALLAPTDLLARQHATTLSALLEPLGHSVEVLTGSLPAAARRAALERLATPGAPRTDGLSEGRIVVGTHALVQEGVTFADLALAVIDEQHRFGVAQRDALAGKGPAPHLLLMTATPIPRTLGQVLHADLAVSDLRTPPAGRPPVTTGIRSSDQLTAVAGDPTRGAYPLIVREVAAGSRAFVVVPLVQDDPAGGARAAESFAVELGGQLEAAAARAGLDVPPRLAIGVVHGRQRPNERDRVMEAFRAGEVNVLVGTTVLEVGVDVPEATVMVVMDADRFGVAQLHQLRGRVGRGEARSYCILVSDSEDPVARARLEAVAASQDGFALAEKDLELRDAGELLGLTQSGLPPFRVAGLQRAADREVSLAARALAERLVDRDGTLHPRLVDLAAVLDHGWLARIGAGEILAGSDAEGGEAHA
ncbi:MAG TPA: ATP-dependent DNA helicase RecG [Candidatus Limnocylindrales bacterium]|nr:ATP-dependent DNA helicase RecG [Candidatus Limnocylindrales bacterium]